MSCINTSVYKHIFHTLTAIQQQDDMKLTDHKKIEKLKHTHIDIYIYKTRWD